MFFFISTFSKLVWKSLSLNSNIESWNDHMYDAQWWTHLSSTFEWMSTYHDKKKSNNTEFDLPYFLPVFTPFQFLLKWEGEQQINIITNDIHQLTPARLLRILQQLWTYMCECVYTLPCLAPRFAFWLVSCSWT